MFCSAAEDTRPPLTASNKGFASFILGCQNTVLYNQFFLFHRKLSKTFEISALFDRDKPYQTRHPCPRCEQSSHGAAFAAHGVWLRHTRRFHGTMFSRPSVLRNKGFTSPVPRPQRFFGATGIPCSFIRFPFRDSAHLFPSQDSTRKHDPRN